MGEAVMFPITQFDDELNPFIEILVAAKVRRFVEVGSRFGGSLWRIATALPVGSTIVSVDSGGGMGGSKPGAQQSLGKCIHALKDRGYDAHLIVGDSHWPETIRRANHFAPFDAAFIDGDHSMEGMIQDWVHYGKHTKICGFHDVAWKKPTPYEGKLVDCKAVWDVLKERYPSATFVHEGGNMGVGVLWPPARK